MDGGTKVDLSIKNRSTRTVDRPQQNKERRLITLYYIGGMGEGNISKLNKFCFYRIIQLQYSYLPCIWL